MGVAQPILRIGGNALGISRGRTSARLRSAHRAPGAVRVAAGIALRDLRPAVDIDRVGILPALQPVRVVGRARNDRAVTAGIRILPPDRRTRPSALQRLHLRGIGAPLVLVVHAGADAIADQPAERGARESGRDALAGAAAELRPDQAAGDRAHEGAGVLPRSGPGLGIAGARRHRQRDERGCTQTHENHEKPPSPLEAGDPPMPTLDLIPKIRAKIIPVNAIKGLRWPTTPRDTIDPQWVFRALANLGGNCLP